MRLALLLLFGSWFGLPVEGQDADQTAPLRVTIRAGEKTHGPGEHDHPRFLEQWSLLLDERGCEVRGGLTFPTAETLADTDVLVMYAAEGASIHGAEREHLEEYLGRGGGIVVLHDAVCGDDPHWFKTVVGGAWEHGHSKWLEGEIGLYFADREHPITRGAANFDFDDEIYYDLHLDPDAHVLANGFHTPFDVTPQMWVYEKEGYRAFVSIQGHKQASFRHQAWRALLLRGIAWAGGRDADLLVTDAELAALRYPSGGPKPPELAQETFTLHPLFEIDPVASEPLVVNPISIDWDPRGRMWVALTPGYPDKTEFSGLPPADSVAILTDTDGDGRMDTRQVFADELDLVTSLVFHEDGVIVSQAPDIYWLRDTDGDDRADEKVTLFTGFGTSDTHAVISNLRWGMDGWIYGTQGYSGNGSRNVIGIDGKDHGHIGNGLFRFRPDGSAIEMVVSYSSNTWGLDFTWDGELFFTMANGSHLRHVVMPDSASSAGRIGNVTSWVDVTDHKEVRPLTKHERPPYQQIDFVGGFTAAAGSCIYDGGAWPQEFLGDHFVCEPTVNLVHRDVLTRDGVTFKARKAREAEFLASTDLWFRPVHVRVGPDGALYVLDFYNQAAVHNDTRGPEHGPTNAAIRPDRDHLHGRIWRVQSKAAMTYAPPALDSTPSVGLVEELSHPNRWRRMTAHRLLLERELEPAAKEALELASVSAPETHARVHALWIMGVKGFGKERLSQARNDYTDEVRRNVWAIEDAYDRLGVTWRSMEAADLRHEPPRTRLQALQAWRGHASKRQRTGLLELYRRLENDWSRSAFLAIAAERPSVYIELILGAEAEEPYLELTERLVGSLARSGDMGESVRVILSLAEHGEDAPLVAVRALETLQRELPGETPWTSPRLETAFRLLIESDDVRIAVAALPIARRWAGMIGAREFQAVSERLRGIAEDPDRDLELRLSCLRSMLALPESRAAGAETAARFLDPYFPLEVQLEVIDMLGAGTDVASARVLVRSFPALSGPAREAAFNYLVQRADWVPPLLEAVEAGEIQVLDLGTHRIHRLRNHPDEALAARAEALVAAGSESDADELIAELLPRVEGLGDAARGAELFEQNCASCHSFRDQGGKVGPDLTGMGAHGARHLLPFILDPNRSVEGTYLEYVADTVDGRMIDGVIVREGAASIVLRNTAGDVELARDEIESLRSTGRSPMPTGFEQLGADGLRDLLTYLAGDYGGFRVLDLRPIATASTEAGMYDRERDDKPMRFRSHGIVDVGGVPFEVLDPARFDSNVLVLKGGMAADWESKVAMPQKVEIPVGFAFRRLHVLGGIAAWGYPFTQTRDPICLLTLEYADGETEERLFVDGVEFADWIRHHDVPGSEFVPILREGSWGQVRRFHVDPARPEAVIRRITLESFDNHLAPTFVALTAQLDEPVEAAIPATAAEPSPPDVLIVGGGSSHDYQRWFRTEGLATLADLGLRVEYTEAPDRILPRLDRLKVLYLANNQPLPDVALRGGIFDFVEKGGGLLLVHASTWLNWTDWPAYNHELVGGGASSHEAYGAFAVSVSGEHPLVYDLPRSFTVEDELYRFEPHPRAEGAILAVGRSLQTDAEYPVVWVRQFGEGRIVGITLGHDGGAHEHPAFRKLLRNACTWLAEER